jgi:hypothetical protein
MRQFLLLWVRATLKAPLGRFAPLLAALPIVVGIATARSWPGMDQLIAGGASILVFVFISHWWFSRRRS